MREREESEEGEGTLALEVGVVGVVELPGAAGVGALEAAWRRGEEDGDSVRTSHIIS